MKRQHNDRVYELVSDTMIGELSLAEAYRAQCRAFNILEKLIRGEQLEEEDEDFFPEPLNVVPYQAIGVLPGEIALAALAIAYGDNLLEVIYDKRDIKAIYKRLNRRVKNGVVQELARWCDGESQECCEDGFEHDVSASAEE